MINTRGMNPENFVANVLITILLVAMVLMTGGVVHADKKKNDDRHFTLKDIFDLEYASDPQISPDGNSIVYVRNFMDIMTDRRRSNLWIISYDGSDHRPLTSGNHNHSRPRWSPDGKRLLYVSSQDGSTQLFMRWMDTGEKARLTNLLHSPGGLTWSPDGKWIAFSMMVPEHSEPFVKMPNKPKDAKWAKPAKVIRKLQLETVFPNTRIAL